MYGRYNYQEPDFAQSRHAEVSESMCLVYGEGPLSDVSHVAIMFVCLIISAIQVLRRFATRRRVLLIYYLYRNVSTRIVQTCYLLASPPGSE